MIGRSVRHRRILVLILTLTQLGIGPWLGAPVRLAAQTREPAVQVGSPTPAVSAAGRPDGRAPFAETATTTITDSTPAVPGMMGLPDSLPLASASEEVIKKAMSEAEKIAWEVGKALIPALAVMGTAVLLTGAPLVAVVGAVVLVGAATGGLVTWLYEKRLNQTRQEKDRKPDTKILRDVAIAAAVNGVMAPFTMATAGLAAALGPTTLKTVAIAAAQGALVNLGGATLSNLTRGAVTNLWYDHVENLDEKEKQLQAHAKALQARTPRTPEQEEELIAVLGQLDDLRKNRYTLENFKQDQEKALIGAAIGGMLGMGATKLGSTSGWAQQLSVKMFGSPDKAGLVAQAVVSNPFAFLTGSANAQYQKGALDAEMTQVRNLQQKYPAGSAEWEFYGQKLADLQKARDAIDVLAEGTKALGTNLAMQSAVMTSTFFQTRFWDLPHIRKQEIRRRFEAEDTAWLEVGEVKADLDALRARMPVRNEFVDQVAYQKAMTTYQNRLQQATFRYEMALSKAMTLELRSTSRQLRLKEIAAEVDAEMAAQAQLALAKNLGGDKYLEVKKQKAAEDLGPDATPEAIDAAAAQTIRQEYQDASDALASSLGDMEASLGNARNLANAKARLDVDANGDPIAVFTSPTGEVLASRPLGQPQATWWQRALKKDPKTMTAIELDDAARQAYTRAAMIKPSKYRSDFVEMQVSSLKALGLSNAEIQRNLPNIVRQANDAMVQTFGGSWADVVKAETLAAGLERARYTDGRPPTLDEMYAFTRTTVEQTTILQFQKTLATAEQHLSGTLLHDGGSSPSKPLTEEERREIERRLKALSKYKTPAPVYGPTDIRPGVPSSHH